MKTLVENCFALSTKLLNKTLRKARLKEPVDNEYLNFRHNGKPSALFYSIEHNSDDNDYLIINFNAELQKILLATRELTFGTRTYLTCGCGQRTNALYLKNTFFACRNCQNLRYQSTNINKTSDHGMFFYQQSKVLKLMELRESMDRIFYRSNYTKKFSRYLNLCFLAGRMDEVQNASDLIDAINERKSKHKK
ncbi:MAG: hypothetical protein ABIG99_00875 [Patescibacteria group bacterium]